jgi:arylmalonate decarboxylase
LTRRQLLQLSVAGVASSSEPSVGLIFPRPGSIPAEVRTLYPSGVRFLTGSIGVGTTLPEEFDLLAGRIAPIAVKLSRDGANAIVLMAPSLSFYRGAAFNQRLSEELTQAAGVPVITASTAIVEGLTLLHARRIAVATAYTSEINLKLQGFLNEFGYEVVILRGLSTERFEERLPVTEVLTPYETMEFIAGVRENRPEADTLLIAFGSLSTLDMIPLLEKRCRIPVVSANPHALRAGVRLAGGSAGVRGFGALLDK